MSEALHFRAQVLPDDDVKDVWVMGGRITYDRPGDATTVATEGWLLPGLIDAHCHVGLGPHGPIEDRDEQEQQALANRDAGTLLIRDCGSPVDNSWIQERPDLPRLIRAGRHLAPHRRYMPGLAIELDDESQLPDAVAEQAANGNGWVKLVGDWIDRSVGDLAPCWTRDVLHDAIKCAHDAGARVTAHIFGEDGLADLIETGIDCIEHGTGLTDDTITSMAARGTALVPTRINIDNFPGIAEQATKFPSYANHMRALHARADETVRAAYDAGIPIYTGSDAGGMVEHGRIVDELIALHFAGMPAAHVVAAASWAGRQWLGRAALEEGAPADFVVVDTDPRLELETLRQPRVVVLDGVVHTHRR